MQDSERTQLAAAESNVFEALAKRCGERHGGSRSRVLVVANPLAFSLDAEIALDGFEGRIEIGARSIATFTW